MINLTREEAQQLLEVFELFLEEAEDVTTLEDNLVQMLRAKLSEPERTEKDEF
jgi:phosphoglycerate-specific signal transduction histidine kinase